MKILSAKILEAHFVEAEYDWRGDRREVTFSYPVYQFESGLILVPVDDGIGYFFDSEENIEGCGMSSYMSAEDTGKTVEMTALELAQYWGENAAEYGRHLSSVPPELLEKVKETLRPTKTKGGSDG